MNSKYVNKYPNMRLDPSPGGPRHNCNIDNNQQKKIIRETKMSEMKIVIWKNDLAMDPKNIIIEWQNHSRE